MKRVTVFVLLVMLVAAMIFRGLYWPFVQFMMFELFGVRV